MEVTVYGLVPVLSVEYILNSMWGSTAKSINLHAVKEVTPSILQSKGKSRPLRAPGPVPSHSKVIVSPLTIVPLSTK